MKAKKLNYLVILIISMIMLCFKGYLEIAVMMVTFISYDLFLRVKLKEAR